MSNELVEWKIKELDRQFFHYLREVTSRQIDLLNKKIELLDGLKRDIKYKEPEERSAE